MKKQVNKINTEIVDAYLNEVEQCRMRMQEAQKIADEKYKEIDDYTALLNKKGLSKYGDEKYMLLLYEESKLQKDVERELEVLNAMCSELAKVVKIKTLEAIAINRHILDDMPVHYKKFKETVNKAIDNKWYYSSYSSESKFYKLYININNVPFKDSSVFVGLKDGKIDWNNTKQYGLILDVDEVKTEVIKCQNFQNVIDAAFNKLKETYKVSRRQIHNKYLQEKIDACYYKRVY